MKEAIKLLSVREDEIGLEDGITAIERLVGELRVVVMIGDGRAGKSFLANKIIGEEVFLHAPTPEAVTAGIDIYAAPYRDGHLLLWDCEGGNNALARTHQMVNVMGMVGASKIVYVVAGMATDAAFETLERNFASRELVLQGSDIEDQEFLFIVNKNNLTYETHHFDNMLDARKGNTISSLYPSEQREFLSLGFEGTPNFNQELKHILDAIQGTKPRTLAGLPMSGPHLAQVLRLVFQDFETRGKVVMPDMARVVIHDNFLAPLMKEQMIAFRRALPGTEQEAYVEDEENFDTRRARMEYFTKKTAHISSVYGDFRSEALATLKEDLDAAWEVFTRRNNELGQVFVKTWHEQQAPVRYTKKKELHDMFGRPKVRYIDVHDVQTRVATMRANGTCEYGEWETIASEERNERDTWRLKRRSTFADYSEWEPPGWLGTIWRAMDRLCSGGVDKDPHETEDKFDAAPTTIEDAAYQGDVQRIKELLAEGAKVNTEVDLTLMTPLHLTARGGHLEAVQLLLEHNANINALDSWQGTPLHAASGEGHTKIVESLLRVSAVKINPLNHYGQTPLDLAIKYKRPPIIQLLRTAGGKEGTETGSSGQAR